MDCRLKTYAVRGTTDRTVVASLLVIKTGSALPGLVSRRKDFDTWIATGTGISAKDLQVVSVFQDEPLPNVRDVQGVIVSGSPAMVTDRAPWSERTAEWLREAVAGEVPVLGICYGHQLLAHALGGEVAFNPRGRHIGTVDVHLKVEAKKDRLFGVFAEELHVAVSHRQCVITLPPDATWLAETERDPHHAFRVGHLAWGVQFHPEFDANILRAYVDEKRAELTAEGFDPDALSSAALESADGTILLRRFADIVRHRN
jgi:GMP synthase (glutamine-hydrolysing)